MTRLWLVLSWPLRLVRRIGCWLRLGHSWTRWTLDTHARANGAVYHRVCHGCACQETRHEEEA